MNVSRNELVVPGAPKLIGLMDLTVLPNLICIRPHICLPYRYFMLTSILGEYKTKICKITRIKVKKKNIAESLRNQCSFIA